MPHYDNQPPPSSPNPELAYTHLATAVLTSLAHDLEAGRPRQKREARLSVEAGAHLVWLDLLDLDEGARLRVLRVLDELAH